MGLVPRSLALIPVLLLGIAAEGQEAPVVDVESIVRAHEWKALVEVGEAALPEVLRLYRSSDSGEKVQIAWMLARVGWKSEAARDVLLEDLASDDENLRYWVLWAQGELADSEEVVDLLVEWLGRGRNPLLWRRDQGVPGYGQLFFSEKQKLRLFTLLIERLGGLDEETRRTAARALEIHTGQLKGYDPAASAERRAAAIEVWERWLEEYRSQL